MANCPEWWVTSIFLPVFVLNFRDFRQFSRVLMHLEALGSWGDKRTQEEWAQMVITLERYVIAIFYSFFVDFSSFFAILDDFDAF